MGGIFGGGGSAKVQGPQTALSMTIQQSSYGTPVQLLYGTNRIYGNLIWYGSFYGVSVPTGGGGGGGKGGGGAGAGGDSETYYYASFSIGLCEGPVSTIGDVYVSKQVGPASEFINSFHDGEQAQPTWGYMDSFFPSQSINYSNLCYIGQGNISLGTSSETPAYSFEASGLKIRPGFFDASPDEFFIDFFKRAGMTAGQLDTFSECAAYWQASNFLISPIIDQQQAANDWAKQVMDTLNSEFVWLPSQGYLTARPYGDSTVTGNGVTYTPNFTPIYSIGIDDLIIDGDEDPITCDRVDLSDVYNQVPIEYVNRADQYNIETYTAFDDGLTDVYGFRIAPTLSAHHITDPNIAQTMAKIYLNRQIYVRNTPITFKLPWNYILLDPLDYIALNEPNFGWNNFVVRILSIEEDEKDGMLTFTAEEVPNAIAGTIVNANFGTSRYIANYNEDPGDINPPVFFESPLALVQSSALEVNIGLSSSSILWGGCDIWYSTDDMTYQYAGQFKGISRMGALTAGLASFTPVSGNRIDTANTLSITMAESNGTLNNAATNADALALNTLCYVDGELIAYGDDALTGTNQYNLTYLNRGCYGSTISAHLLGSPFVRMDNGIFSYEADQAYIGKTLYFKFLSFNAWGGGIQTLDEVSPYAFILAGAPLLTPLANPDNLTTNYFGDIAQMNWSPVTDIRSPIFYEIRKGSTFASAQFIGRTTQTSYRVFGSGTYWISAFYVTSTGQSVYSSSPPSIAIATPTVVNNVIGSFDEFATGFTGTKTNCSVVSGNLITTSGSATALYQAPTGHNITSAYQVSASVVINWLVAAVNAASDVTAIADITTVPDITFAGVQGNVVTTPQVQIDGGAWQNWQPGVYTFTTIVFRLSFAISDITYQAVVSGFSFEVDVQDYVQTGSVNTSASAIVAVSFPFTFNTIPALTTQIVNASAGDDVIITAATTGGFTIEVLNSGVKVVRAVTWNAQGW